MKTVYIFVPNDPRIKNNALFDVSNDPNFSIYKTMQQYFQKQKVEMKTMDMGTPKASDIILCFDTPFLWNRAAWNVLKQSPARKVLLAFEPPIVNPFNYIEYFNNFFDAVLTWNDALVDNEKYFKYNWPQSNNYLQHEVVPFKKKKFLTLINGNKLPFFLFKPLSRMGKELYTARIESIDYFEEHIPTEFDLYGVGWNQPKKYNLSERVFGFKKYKVYKGRIDNKIEVLSTYKFCMCFENLTKVNGYFTEKLFDAFKARTVPIYWGAENVTSYIPSNCFIDYREFSGYADLIEHLKKMPEKTYNNYINNIEKLLNEKKFLQVWFEDGFAKRVYEVLI